MPDNRKNQSNAIPISSNKSIQEMKVKNPDRPADCIHFIRTGSCVYGTNCRYNHPPLPPTKTVQDTSELPLREGQPDCEYYLKTGTCKYGSLCKYHHPLDRRGAGPMVLNTLGLPIRQGEKRCPYYMQTQTCKFGPACKFDHPQPASLETTLPVNGPAATGTFPPTGIPYVGTFPAWSLPRSSYVASSRVPGLQTYMPYLYPPLQNPLPAQGMNTYMGNLTSVSASDMMGQNFVYNSKSRGELVNGGPVDFVKQAISNLPERPDQPECRFFMSSGSCKYGLNCKFHHPKERIAHYLGPHGLPFRPGADLCNYFSSYGVCKYGPTCKFDHPIYPASYLMGMPSVPTVDLSYFPVVRNMVMSNSTETSNSNSTKITDWIQKPDSVPDKNSQKSLKNSVEDANENVHDDHANAAAQTASEVPQDQSD